jgi:hypothetical protein
MTSRHSAELIDREVDAFVRKINELSSDDTRPEWELPEFLRVGPSDSSGWFHWRIQPITSAPWLVELTAALPMKLPTALDSLLRRYAFPLFVLKSVRLFANTGHNLPDEMRLAMSADRKPESGSDAHRLRPNRKGTGR